MAATAQTESTRAIEGEVALPTPTRHIVRQPRVAIIGAGLSGIGAGVQLKRVGLDGFVIFEKAASLGGTWRDNHYPGLACDVSSPFYTWTFAPNPRWSSTLPKGREIRDYAERTALAEGLNDHFRFDTEVVRAVWEDNGWTLVTSDGEGERFDFVITAVGFLHYARTPTIAGLDTFRGPVLHTARWDDSVSYRGKRVGVIGNGSSGTQIISALTKDTSKMVAFIRTPQWIYPLEDVPFSSLWRFTHRWVPGVWKRTWRRHQLSNDQLVKVFAENGPERAAFGQAVRSHLQQIEDPELRAKLTPDYEPGCKRTIISSKFYPAIQLPQAEVVRDAIARVEPEGIRTEDGTLRELDIVVVATGYDAQAFLTHIEIVGEGGRRIQDEWQDGFRTYLGVTLDGYPNMFMLGGPHAPFGTISFILSGQMQGGYAVRWIQAWAAGEFDSLVPTVSAVDGFTAEVRAKATDTPWGSGCTSWYLDATGVPSPWPFTAARFRNDMTHRRSNDYELRQRDGGRAADFPAAVNDGSRSAGARAKI